MQNVHPIFQTALRGIAPPADAKHWQGINDTLRAALASFDAPPCPAGQFLYVHKHPTLGALDCHLEWEDGDPEVGWTEQVTLCAAYLRGVDITDRLTDDEVEAIETAAYRAPKEFQEPA